MLDDKNGTTEKVSQLAVLIDAENISDKYIQYIFEELSNYSEKVTVKRIYGDWTSGRLNNWKMVLLDYSITPIQQFSYTTGKNSTDSALIIDAMDLLYSEDLSAFCIVSSDSDFTRLASRLRESGKTVIGMGERKTPKPFISACDVFRYLEVLSEHTTERAAAEELLELVDLIRKYVDENSDESGFIFLGKIGNFLQKRLPDFDVRNYGYTKLSGLIKATDAFRIEMRGTKDAAPLTYIANK